MYNGFNEHIPTDMFPKTLESMKLNLNYGKTRMTPDMFPSLKELYFHPRFNEVIVPGVLPKGLKRLGFYDDFNTGDLIVYSRFNQRIDPGVLPQGLEELELGTYYTQELLPGSLPASLTSFKCWTISRQIVSLGASILPPNLKRLALRS